MPFNFSCELNESGNTIGLTYRYQSLKQEVAPEDFSLYIQNVEKARELCVFLFNKPDSVNVSQLLAIKDEIDEKIAASEANPVNSSNRPTLRWQMIKANLLGLVLGIGGFFGLMFFRSKKDRWLGKEYHSKLDGVRGWLALFAIINVLHVFNFGILGLMNIVDYWSSSKVINEGYLGFIFWEILITAVGLPLSLFLTIRLFQKHPDFPRLFMIVNGAVLGLIVVKVLSGIPMADKDSALFSEAG